MNMKYYVFLFITIFSFNSCNTPKPISMNEIAESYVRLVLEIGQYDSDFVDAYYGPEEWKPSKAKADTIPSNEFISRVATLLKQCDEMDVSGFSAPETARLFMFK